MATFYLDYEGGSDAADGTSFANRWKTITSGATAVRIAPGDTIRVMSSPDPTSLGINATWTNGSATVTLASALNVLITDCDTAWTAAANVTATASTTRRSGTNSASLAIASGFTTGKAAYFDLGSNQNYSGYQGITLWYRANATVAASTLSIRLCSDATGDTSVDTLVLPALSQANQWVPVYIDKGSALGASIRSIALYGDADPGTVTVLLDNISTTKAAGNDCLNLTTLLGKNVSTETWWGIRVINGTTVTLDASPTMDASSASGFKGYFGTAETVTGYIRRTIKTDLAASATATVQTIQDSGTLGNNITFSGGWNRTDMSTQTGETWFDGQSGNGYGVYLGTRSYVTIEKINAVRYYTGIRTDSTSTGIRFLGDIHTNNCANIAHYFAPTGLVDATYRAVEATGTLWACASDRGFSSLNLQNVTFNKMFAYGIGWTGFNSAIDLHSIADVKITEIRQRGSVYGGVIFTNTLYASWIGSIIVTDPGNFSAAVTNAVDTTIDYVEVPAVSISTVGFGNLDTSHSNFVIKQMVIAVNSSCQGLWLATGGSEGSNVVIEDYTATGAGSGIRYSVGRVNLTILKSNITATTPIFFDSGAYGVSRGGLHMHNYNGTVGDHRNYYGAGSHRVEVFSEGTVRHTASGLAWKISPMSTTYWTANVPFIFSVGKVALAANVTKTLTLWARRTNTGITGIFRCRGGQLAGITTTQTDSISVAADIWEMLSLTVTPTQAGVVELEMLVYGGSTYSVYIDDLGVS